MSPQTQSPDTLELEDAQPAVVIPQPNVAKPQPVLLPTLDIPAGDPKTAALAILARIGLPVAAGQKTTLRRALPL